MSRSKDSENENDEDEEGTEMQETRQGAEEADAGRLFMLLLYYLGSSEYPRHACMTKSLPSIRAASISASHAAQLGLPPHSFTGQANGTR